MEKCLSQDLLHYMAEKCLYTPPVNHVILKDAPSLRPLPWSEIGKRPAQPDNSLCEKTIK